MPRPLLIFPLGSTEQHGPHLPLETDTIIIEAVVTGVVHQLASTHIHVAPTMAVTASDEHRGFPGTLSIGTEATTAAIVSMCRSARKWTCGVVIANGHGGNHDALANATGALAHEGIAHRVWNLPAYAGGDSHAGHTETSLMLHIAPQLVRTASIERGNTAPVKELIEPMRTGGVAAVSGNGILGDPTTATADHGAQVLEMYITSLHRAVTESLREWSGR